MWRFSCLIGRPLHKIAFTCGTDYSVFVFTEVACVCEVIASFAHRRDISSLETVN
jgi:hypothetical protein